MKYQKPAKDEIDIYLTNNIREDWKRKRLGDETFEALDELWEPVAWRSREQGHAFWGWATPMREVHRDPCTEDYFQRNFERAMLIRPSFDPSKGVPLKLFIKIDLKRTDWHGDLWDSHVALGEHQGRRLARARRHSFDKKEQKKYWMQDGGKPQDFDIFDRGNWRSTHTLLQDFDGGEVSFAGFESDEPSSDQDVEQEVEALIDAERYAMFMATLTEEERLMFLYAKQGKNHQWISDHLGLGVERKAIGRRVRKIEDRLRVFLGLVDTGGDNTGN